MAKSAMDKREELMIVNQEELHRRVRMCLEAGLPYDGIMALCIDVRDPAWEPLGSAIAEDRGPNPHADDEPEDVALAVVQRDAFLTCVGQIMFEQIEQVRERLEEMKGAIPLLVLAYGGMSGYALVPPGGLTQQPA